MSDTPITPTVGAATLAGTQAALVSGTVTSRVPTVGAATLAGVAPSYANVGGVYSRSGDSSGQLVTYTALVNGKAGVSYPDLGQPNPAPGGYESITMQAVGTFGAGGSIQLEGSNDGATWAKLSPAALTSAGFTVSLGAGERPRYIRPNVTAGDGTTSITASIWLTFGP